jgi:putative CocE/NonD family hydrolase
MVTIEQVPGRRGSRRLAGSNGRRVRGLLARPHSRVAGTQLAGWEPKAVSPKRHRVVLDADVEVPLPDGTILRGDLYRPKAPGAFPTLLAWSCYPKDFQHTGIPMPINESGAVTNLVARGYCHVHVNSRGTGRSDGDFQGLLSLQEQRDVADTIEWVATQPWCDGNVGMTGMSYYALIQYLAAAQRPSHLRAIFPYMAWTDYYRHAINHGGAPNTDFLSTFFCGAGTWATKRLAPRVRHAMSRVFDRAWFQWLCKQVFLRLGDDGMIKRTHPDEAWVRHFATRVFDERDDGPFYRERSASPVLDRVQVPVLIGTNWGNPVLHTRGAFDAWHRLHAPKQLFVGPPSVRWPWQDYQREMLAWYDHHLKGLDTGVDQLPPVRYWLQGGDRWRTASDWPVPGAREVRFQLVARGTDPTVEHLLTPDATDAPTQLSFLAIPRGMRYPAELERYESQVLRYATEPFEVDTEVVGPITLHLRIISTAPDTHVVARVSDLAPDGKLHRKLSWGWLQAAHRTIDQAASRPDEIAHDHSVSIALVPGEPYELDISLIPTANLFRAGHRVLLEVASRPDLVGATMFESIAYYAHEAPPYACRNTLLHGPDGCHLAVLVRSD